MLHIKYELKQDNDDLVAEISSSMTKTNTKEVEYCIAYLIDIIKIDFIFKFSYKVFW